ncbi:MAG: hypothetical protein PVI71_06965 [Desulfobacterales bacterium]|jgi:hypothetical protein
MLDVAVAYNRYKFLGNEFLTWLWFVVEQEPSLFKDMDPDLTSLEIGNRIVLENKKSKSVERITIKGEDAHFEEGMLALKKGALVAELNLIYRTSGQKWQFTLKGESLNLSGFKTPKTTPLENPDDLEGAILEKVFLYDKILQFLQKLYKDFIQLRTSITWQNRVVPLMKTWMHAP